MTDRRVWRYRRGEDGDLESVIFSSPDVVPSGQDWVDSPALIAPEAPPKRKGGWPKGRPRKPKEPETAEAVEAVAEEPATEDMEG